MLKPKGMDKEHYNIFSIILQSENEGIINGKFSKLQEKFFDNFISPIKDLKTKDKMEQLYWEMVEEIKKFYFEMGIITGSQTEYDYFKINSEITEDEE